MSNLKKDIEEILKDFVLWRTKIIDGKPVATYDKNMLSEWEREQYQPMEAVTQIINLIESVVPEEKNRKTDDEYGYCITCNQIIDSPEADCFCTIHNLVISDIKSKLIDGSKNNGK